MARDGPPVNPDSVDTKIYEQLRELKRQERPCLLVLQETIVAVKEIHSIDDPSASLPRIRVIGTDEETKDIPLSMIEGVSTPSESDR